MDDMRGRQHKLENRWRRPKAVRSYGYDSVKRTFAKFLRILKNHTQSLLAIVLLAAMTALLFGIFSQFQPPAADSTPSGVNAVSYNTFVGQVQTGNILAVTIQGNDVNGLLANPLGQDQASAAKPVMITPEQRAAAVAAWMRSLSANNTSWMASPAGIDPAHTIYTRLPGSGDAALVPLLLSNHVVIKWIPLAQASIWLGLLMRFLPLILLVVLLLVMLAPRKGPLSARTMDDRISQIGKSRARRFERVKENSAPRPVKPGQAPTRLGNDASASRARHAGKSQGADPRLSPPPSLVSTGRAPRVSRASLEPPVTFADVAGIDEVRVELEEIVQFLRDSERYRRLGARIPRGALLVGQPGTGKTLLAKAVAGEASVPFFSMSASEFVEIYVGVGASRVRDLFNQARQASPCVVFIDEIDAVGRKRSMRVNASDEREQTLNQLLVELDGFDPRQAVVVLAATNRVDILDKALLRPGRFDRQIIVPMPDRAGREAILKVHTRNTPLHDEVSLNRLARMTTGMSGADLANLVNEAALCAARQDLERITHDCFEDALARVQLGTLRPLVMSETERRIIAFHEGGHALVAHYLPEADTVNRVTILPRGQSLGVTQFVAEEDRYNYSRQMLMARIAVGLGGRAAEELTFGPERITTGAENDLQVVTDLARRMVTRWGMSEQVGVVFADYRSEAGAAFNLRRVELPTQPHSLVADANGHLLSKGDELPPTINRGATYHEFAMMSPTAPNASSASMAALIDAEVQRILNEGRDMARAILREHSDQLTILASTLMEREQLSRVEFEALLDG